MKSPTAPRFLRLAVRLFALLALPNACLAQITAVQIVDRMAELNQQRTAHLAHFTALRHYRVEYSGVTHLAADLEVQASWDARTGKSFRIISESGSHMLCEKVLRRAVDTEREASQDHNATALTAANYSFSLLGEEPVNGRPAYILAVDPISPSRYLYRGRIWVDAVEFALVKIDASPAKSPSFWIARTHIEQSFVRLGEFWQPARNRSETHVRVGGTAVFTIDYGSYQLQPAAALAADANPH
jgi:hypothetical protein